MRIVRKLMFASLVLLGGCLLVEVAFAGQLQSDPHGKNAISEFGEPVSSNILESLSGGQGMQIDTIDLLVNNMNLKSEMDNNILYSAATTGVNMVSNDAFSGASGISTVIQNSGNQVIINSALILNLRIQ